MHNYFHRLGSELERAWLDADRDPEAFPKLAEDVIARLPPADHFDREAFLDHELEPFGGARRERAPLGAFGQPGVTVYFGRDFVIEVYLWVDAIAGLHDHPFRGLFVILEGESVHATYSFTEKERVGARLRIGELRSEGVELLRAGDHRLFSLARHPLIHTLVHVSVPSISMVIRTIRSMEYWRFLPPSIALSHEESDQVIARQLATLNFLRQSNDARFGERLDRYLRSSDLETCYLALFPFWIALDDAARMRLLDVIRERHGSRADVLAPSLAEFVRVSQANALRGQLSDPDDRLVATALLCCDNREQVLSLLGARHEDPAARLHRFIDELGTLATGDETSADAAHLLVNGKGSAGLEHYVQERFGTEAVERERAQIARFCTESLFAALAR